MVDPEQVNADQLAFWNGQGGRTWVARQAHTDTILAPVSKALLRAAAAQPGEAVLDVGCGCGASTIEVAHSVGPQGRVAAFDISSPMLEEGRRRAALAGVSNIDWLDADPSTAALPGYDLLLSNFGVMFFGDPVAAFSHLRRAANPGARMVFVCWRGLGENPWMKVPMDAASAHLPPRPKTAPNAPGMFAFSDPDYLSGLLSAAGCEAPRIESLDLDLDIAAGRGLEEAVAQSTQIGAVSSWLRGQPAEVAAAAAASIREQLATYQKEECVRLRGAMWLVSSKPARAATAGVQS
jgi:SAM-dependent methyltransferase